MTFMRVGWVLLVALGVPGCGKKNAPPSEPTQVKKVSVADEPSAPAPAPPGAETPAEAPPATPQLAVPVSPELAKIIVAVQKHALATGRFPTGWNEVIAAKIVDEVPKGRDGRPMTWKEFERSIAPE